jgi:hypothetical protein
MSTNARQKLLSTFSIDHDSKMDGRRYIGQFTTKKLTIRDMAALGVRKAQLNGGLHYDAGNPGHGVDEQTDEFNSMIAHLELSLVQKPEWWKLDDITDIELVGLIYKEVLSFENTFLGRGRSGASTIESGAGQQGETSQGDSSKTQEQPNVARSPSQVVVGQVQTALEP